MDNRKNENNLFVIVVSILILIILALWNSNEGLKRKLREKTEKYEYCSSVLNELKSMRFYNVINPDVISTAHSFFFYLKIGDGQNKYIVPIVPCSIKNAFLPKNGKFKQSLAKDIAYSCFFDLLNSSNDFLILDKPEFDRVKKYSPELIPYDLYLQCEKKLSKMTLREILRKYFIIGNNGNSFFFNKSAFSNKPECRPIIVAAYLFFKYGIVFEEAGCLAITDFYFSQYCNSHLDWKKIVADFNQEEGKNKK